MERDVHEVEAERAGVEGPVEDVARLEDRAHAGAGTLEERAPGVHRRIVDDDVVVVEVERADERWQVCHDRNGGQQGRPGKSGPDPELHQSCGWNSKARSSTPAAFHQRLRAFSSTRTTRTPLRSAIATEQLPARPVEPVLTPIAPW